MHIVDLRVGQHGLCCLVSGRAESDGSTLHRQTPKRFETDEGEERQWVTSVGLCWSHRLCCISVEAWFLIVALVCICVYSGGTVTVPSLDVLTVFQTQSFMECAAFIVTLVNLLFFSICLFVSFVFCFLFRTARVQV